MNNKHELDDQLLSHLLKNLEGSKQAEVDRLIASDPAVRSRYGKLQLALRPLAVSREEYDPPTDLVLRTLGRVAEHMVANSEVRSNSECKDKDSLKRASAATGRLPARPVAVPAASEANPQTIRSRNLFATIGLSLALLALVFPAVIQVRNRAQMLACQDTMRQFHQSLVGYSDVNDGRFPQVNENQRVASVAMVLRDMGYLASDSKFNCPAQQADETVAPVVLANYAYSLGYRDEGGLHGLTHQPDNDYLPLLADAPLRSENAAVPVNHRNGQNVLFAGGNVRFCTTPHVGVGGDDIFCNAAGKVGAGLYRLDSALGRSEERP